MWFDGLEEMALTLLGILILAGVAIKVMSGEDRERSIRIARALLLELRAAAKTPAREQPFRDALKERSARVYVMPALIALNLLFFLSSGLGIGPFGNWEALVNLGPRTTNGEWWRLVTAMFVQQGLGQLLICCGALYQIGSVLERLGGRSSFAGVYLIGGIVGGLVQLSAHAATAGYGASPAIGALYGMLGAFVAWGHFHADAAIPFVTLKRLAPITALFLIHTLSQGITGEVLAACCTGIMFSVGLLMGMMEPRPQPRRLGAVVAAALVVVVTAGIPLRGIADVWPDLKNIVAAEDRTAKAFEAADKKFRARRMTSDALADFIDDSIIPALVESDSRLKSIRKVPQEHERFMEAAKKYLALRTESWRLRSAGLRRIELRALAENSAQEPSAVVRRKAEAQHRANLVIIGNAEGKASASLQALQIVRSATLN